jgi:hypothetical protein
MNFCTTPEGPLGREQAAVFNPEDAESICVINSAGMWDALTFIYTSAIIIIVAVFLFVAVGDLEPNPRLAALLKAAIIAAAGAVITNHLLSSGLLAAE